MNLQINSIKNSSCYVEAGDKVYLIKIPLDKFKIWFQLLPALVDDISLIEMPENTRLASLKQFPSSASE